jgi:pyruvate formate lyase activating enzyme
MGVCKICGKDSPFTSSFIGVCRRCILSNPRKAIEIGLKAHSRSRHKFGLPPAVPRDPKGVKCHGCGNECQIPEGKRGFCNLVENRSGRLVRYAGTSSKGLASWYYDAHVTNCVAAPWCPAGTGCGYPHYACTSGPEYGYYNLAVFFSSCNFDCLFCCNWHWRHNAASLKPIISAQELVNAVHPRVSCVCYFGGTSGPQLPFAINTSRLIRKRYPNQIIRFCLEENGNMNPRLMKTFADLALESGGSIKFDLKSFNEAQNIVLCGVSNKVVLRNFKLLVEYHQKRPEVPFLYASTLLVPGYVEVEEVADISKFIAELDPTIPYNLLAFDPLFEMSDMPYTSREVAEECYRVARENGLEKVRIGNLFLLR